MYRNKMPETKYEGDRKPWKGCCLKSRLWTKSALREHAKKYSGQFATFEEDRDKTVVIAVLGKEVEISKEQFKEDWVID